jgi:hypothetical protein
MRLVSLTLPSAWSVAKSLFTFDCLLVTAFSLISFLEIVQTSISIKLSQFLDKLGSI